MSTRKIFFAILLLLPLAVVSQDAELKPLWELSLNKATPYRDYISTNLLELNDGNYLVPLVNTQDYLKTDERACEAKILKISADGKIMDEIIMRYDKEYNVNDISIDIWNDTINVFSHLIANNHRGIKIMHNYLLNDMSVLEQKEIYKTEFDTLLYAPYMSRKGNVPLIDKEGNRSVAYGYTSINNILNKNGTKGAEDYYVIDKVMFLRFNSKLNIVAEKWYEIEELHFNFNYPYTLNYNIDSTAYYFMPQTCQKPWNPQYVLDLDFNLKQCDTYVCDPQGVYDVLECNWCQNPYNGEIYGFGEVHTPWQDSELFMFKLNRKTFEAEYSVSTNTLEGITMGILPGRNISFSPDGKIYGLGIYGYVFYTYFVYNANICYICVFDKKINRLNDWFYQKSPDYNYFFDNIYCTKTDDIIITGELRHEMGGVVYYEPYMTKFPASAFNPENIEEAHANNLHLAVAYPNPGGDVMNIRTGLRNAVLTVYDINGRKIHEQEITDDVTSVDASKWQSGTYIWKLGIRNEELGMKEVESGKWVK